jgi:hypothetical protein
LRDNPPGNITAGATGNGNTLDINGNYPANFDIEEMFLEVKRKLVSVDLMVFFENLKNRDIEALNKAHTYGLQVVYKTWTLTGAFQEVQKDAVVGAFTNSDFGGGFTSARGQVWSVGYKISKKVQVQYTLFKNETALDTIPMKYDRSHVDLSMSF